MDPNHFLAEILGKSVRNNYFYHFTDTRNLPSIKKLGLLSSERLTASGIVVPAPGGNEWSRDADARFGMHKFVHLCFDTDHPMEFAARKDGRIERSIFLRIKPEVIHLPGVLMTVDVSNQSGIVPGAPAVVLPLLDLEVLYSKTNWKDAEIRKRLAAARRCEILVPHRISPEYIIDG